MKKRNFFHVTRASHLYKEFKGEAIRLLESRGKSIAQLAADLDIAQSNVYRWKIQFGQHDQHAFPGSGQIIC